MNPHERSQESQDEPVCVGETRAARQRRVELRRGQRWSNPAQNLVSVISQTCNPRPRTHFVRLEVFLPSHTDMETGKKRKHFARHAWLLFAAVWGRGTEVWNSVFTALS